MNQQGGSSSDLKSSSCSPAILKLLVDIENEAFGPQPKPKAVPKDYMKENLKRLKEIHEKSKQKTCKNKPVLPLKQPSQYREVKSKVSTQLKECGSVSKNDPLLEDKKYVVKETAPSVTVTHKNSHIPHSLGHVPVYLQERKKLWEEEENRRLKQQVDASIPPGHTLLSDEERQETLLLLRKNQDELLQRLSSLPVRSDTMKLRNFKEELEKQLAKVDEGIKIFSRPKVLIKNDV